MNLPLTLLAFVVALSVLIVIHEFGHYWVARRCGVKVLRFSIGLGRPLWARRGRDGTEYVIAAIPLGGYVKMLDEREAEVEASELARSFNRKPLPQRMAIVAAGPVFNLAFALAAFWLMLLVGVRDYAPYIGESTGLAARSGLERGDLILSVDGNPASNWTHVLVDLTTSAYRGKTVAIDVRRANGEIATRQLATREMGAVDEERIFDQLGLKPWHWAPPATVGALRAGDPAELWRRRTERQRPFSGSCQQRGEFCAHVAAQGRVGLLEEIFRAAIDSAAGDVPDPAGRVFGSKVPAAGVDHHHFEFVERPDQLGPPVNDHTGGNSAPCELNTGVRGAGKIVGDDQHACHISSEWESVSGGLGAIRAEATTRRRQRYRPARRALR